MSAAKDKPVSKVPTEEYRNGWDRIFGKKLKPTSEWEQLELPLNSDQCPPETCCNCDHCER